MTTPAKPPIAAVIALILFLAAYFPVLQILVGKWAGSDEYTHAFLIVPIILYMVWLKKDLRETDGRASWIGLTLVLTATACYLFGLLTQVHTILLLSMYVTLVGSLIYLFGIRIVGWLFTPLLLFLMLIPVPEQLYTQVTSPLQLMVSRASATLIHMLGIPLLRVGNAMHLPNQSFEVVEACSGLRSVITLLTLSVIMGYFMLQRTSPKIILFLSSVPIAIIVNIFRIVFMIVLYHYWQINVTEGVWHTLTGLLVFTLALAILFFIQKALESWEQRSS